MKDLASKIIELIIRIYDYSLEEPEDRSTWSSLLIKDIRIDLYYESSNEVENLRIWNYSGKESNKGVKNLLILKDKHQIFKGVIKEFNKYNSDEENCTVIKLNTFNSSPNKNRFGMKQLISSQISNKFSTSNLNNSGSLTAQDLFNEEITESKVIESIDKLSNKNIKKINIESIQNSNSNYLPASARNPQKIITEHSETLILDEVLKTSLNKKLSKSTFNFSNVKFKSIKIILTSNHGDSKYIGLTGIQLINCNGENINIEQARSIGAMPKDINTVSYNNGDPRIFENIFNMINETADDNYMWLTLINNNLASSQSYPPYIEIVFDEPQLLSNIKVWNYNKPDELDKGVKSIDVIFDDDYSDIKSN